MVSILNVRSNTHNSCEDSVFVKENKEVIYGVVADGCSTGVKSHFASQAIAYIVENSLYQFVTTDHSIGTIRDVLASLRALLGISHISLLSTAILFVYDKESKHLKVRAFGDGVYYVNDIEYVIEQNNTPDYLAYHITDRYDQFLEYLGKYPTQIYDNVKKFMICSDGITRIERSALQHDATVNPQVLLFTPPKSANYLTRMWNLIKKDGFILSDDLTIVSYAS